MVSPVPTGHNYKDIQKISPHHKEQLWKKLIEYLVVIYSIKYTLKRGVL